MFSDRESEQQHRTMTFAELPNHPLLTDWTHARVVSTSWFVNSFVFGSWKVQRVQLNMKC